MTKLTVIASAKINLHLEVLGFRDDKYHELAMVMQSIDLSDRILINPNKDGLISLECNDSNLSVDDDNLIVRAAKLLREKSNSPYLGAHIVLEKNIPIGAGLAGGSADAAGTLIGLNLLWETNYKNSQLEEISSLLGSDIPFCIQGGTQMCFGRGEILDRTKSINDNLALLLVKDPKISISTPETYRRYRDLYQSEYLSNSFEYEIKRKELANSKWLESFDLHNPTILKNDLQRVVENECEQVSRSLRILRSIPGALAVAMSGSGPSCFAIFPNLDAANKAFHNNYDKFKNESLDVWCCSFLGKGVSYLYD